MVIGLLALTAIPTTIGTCEAVAESRKAESRDKEAKRDEHFELEAYCSTAFSKSAQVHGARVVLRDNKMYLSASPTPSADGQLLESFYIHFPADPGADKPVGLVAMVSEDPPALGWVYVDAETHEVRYGKRSEALPHLVGPWDMTDDEAGVTFEGWEGFVAVEEQEDVWAVYFDRGDDGVGLPKGRRIVDISLERRVMREEDRRF